MCGRFSLHALPAEIAVHFGLSQVPAWQPRYNIAPTQNVPVVRSRAGVRRDCATARWGLVPEGGPGPDAGPLLINARSETAAEKPFFRTALEHRRCLVPADGFYEWKKLPRVRQPYFFRMRDGSVFGFAAIWEEWEDPSGGKLLSCAILTTSPNALVAPIHDRMPVIVRPEAYADWLNPDRTVVDADAFEPLAEASMSAYAVSSVVNAADHDGPDCQREVVEPLELDLFS